MGETSELREDAPSHSHRGGDASHSPVRRSQALTVVVEQRVQVAPTRFRIPDVCIVLGAPNEQVFRNPPFLCVEILSPEDRMSRVEQRIDDYLAMGVRFVWILDPATRRAYAATAETGLREIREAILKTESPVLELPLAEVFE